MNVAVVGASDKPDRFSYKAIKELTHHGHAVYPVHPKIREVQGIPVYHSLKDIPAPVDTITMYVNADKSATMERDILDVKPDRVIFNPGAENPALAAVLDKAGIEVVEHCTLVMLSQGKF